MARLFFKFRQDMRGIAFFGTALFVTLALASFNPLDPSLNSTGKGLQVTNLCGYVGSFLSDLLYQSFGLVAWFLVMILFWQAWSSLRYQTSGSGSGRWLWATLLLLSASALIGMHFPELRYFGDQILAGGVIGFTISTALTKMLNFGGAAIVLWTSTFFLLVLFFERSISEILSAPLQFLSERIEKLRDGLARWSEGRRRKKEAKEELAIESNEAKPKKSLFTFAKKKDEEGLGPARFLSFKEKEAKVGSAEAVAIATPLIEGESELDSEEDQEILPVLKRKVRLKARVPTRVENWEMPKISMLEDPPATRVKVDDKEVRRKADLLTSKLAHFNVRGQVVGARPGPMVTMFEFKPDDDIRVARVAEMADDLSLALSAESLRIIAPLPGRDVVGIETSNSQRESVYLKDLLAQDDFWDESKKLPIALGRKADGTPKIVDLRKMPHLLVAGTTGSGKSVFTVSTLTGLLFRHSPRSLKLILVDPKQVDLAAFGEVPHLAMPVIQEPKKAVSALRWAVKEMEKRYRSMSKFRARGLEAFNEMVMELSPEEMAEHTRINEELEASPGGRANQYYHQPLPYIVIVVEEFADLMAVDKSNVEQQLMRLAQMARACGIHLILAMQSPRKEVVTGVIKTNFPGRISFKVASKTDSRIIIDESGAERLLGRGDMLFVEPGQSKPERHHGPWISDDEIAALTEFWADQGEPEFDPLIMKLVDQNHEEGGADGFDLDEAEYDEKYDEIVAAVASLKEVSASLLQRRFNLGYPRAARLIEIMEKEGVVGPANGSKPRQVLVSSLD